MSADDVCISCDHNAHSDELPLRDHVHFHVVPRMPDLPDELRGPAVFALLGPQNQASIDHAAIDAFAHDLQQILQR